MPALRSPVHTVFRLLEDTVNLPTPTDLYGKLLFLNGFEEGSNAGWNTVGTLITSNVNQYILSGAARTGGYGYRHTPFTDEAFPIHVFPTLASDATLYARTYFRPREWPDGSTLKERGCSVATFGRSTSTPIVHVGFSKNQKLTVTLLGNGVGSSEVNAESGTTLTLLTWYRVELLVTHIGETVTATVTLYLGDATTPLETVTVTAGAFTLPFVRYSPRSQYAIGVGGSADIDDVTLRTDAYPGPGAITLWGIPRVDETTQWSRSGATTHAGALDDLPGVPDDATSYTFVNSATAEDRFLPGGIVLPPGAGVLKGLQLQTRAYRASSSPATHQLVLVDHAGNVFRSIAGTPLNTGYALLPTDAHLYLGLDGLIPPALNAFRVGYRAQASGAEQRITALWANVESRP